MILKLIFAAVSWLWVLSVTVDAKTFVGMGYTPYEPLCGHGCFRSLSVNKLSCSGLHSGDHKMFVHSMITTSECFANDTAWLTSFSYCITTKCKSYGYPLSVLQSFWEMYATGSPEIPPKWTLEKAVDQIQSRPTRVLESAEVLNYTAHVNDTLWALHCQTLDGVRIESKWEARYGVALIVTGCSIPILLHCMEYVPVISGFMNRIKPYLVWPSTVGTYQVRSLPYLVGNPPTVGQALYIAVMVILNVVLTAVTYKTNMPNTWYTSMYQNVMAFVCWRTGFLAFTMLPLTILFAGRNNLLIWLTHLSHSTYMLLHRWMARIYAVQVIIHAIIGLVLWIDRKEYASSYSKPWWIWGSVATITTSIMFVGSGLYIRRKHYELFLISHILLAIFTIIGCWWHIEDLFGKHGYLNWMFAASAVWAFDRLLRLVRLFNNGVRRARIEDIGSGYLRIDITGIRWGAEPGRHAYVYFPTLSSLRPWENHPFSVMPTSALRSFHHSIAATSDQNSDKMGTTTSDRSGDLEKHGVITPPVRPRVIATAEGVTFFVKKRVGMTKLLEGRDNVLTFLDGPYPNNHVKTALACDRLLLITGGIGISAMIPWLRSHPNVKLCWSVKDTAKCLISTVDVTLAEVADKEIRIGRRLEVEALIAQEVESGWEKIGVVACGPPGLCDSVRAAVVVAARKGPAEFELEIDAYSW